jgi:hypothetical protein
VAARRPTRAARGRQRQGSVLRPGRRGGAYLSPYRPIRKSALIRAAVELEITPAPDEAEREAIAAALAEQAELPPAYVSAWRRAGLTEVLDPDVES